MMKMDTMETMALREDLLQARAEVERLTAQLTTAWRTAAERTDEINKEKSARFYAENELKAENLKLRAQLADICDEYEKEEPDNDAIFDAIIAACEARKKGAAPPAAPAPQPECSDFYECGLTWRGKTGCDSTCLGFMLREKDEPAPAAPSCDSCASGPRVKGEIIDSCKKFAMADQCYDHGFSAYTAAPNAPPSEYPRVDERLEATPTEPSSDGKAAICECGCVHSINGYCTDCGKAKGGST
jgi:hypothetical protein